MEGQTRHEIEEVKATESSPSGGLQSEAVELMLASGRKSARGERDNLDFTAAVVALVWVAQTRKCCLILLSPRKQLFHCALRL
jgi:hypothetical protein